MKYNSTVFQIVNFYILQVMELDREKQIFLVTLHCSDLQLSKNLLHLLIGQNHYYLSLNLT